MGFILFILIFALFLILIPVIRVAFAVRNARQQFRRAMGGAFGNDNESDRHAKQESPASSGSKKIFSKDDGEYVSFEEIKIEETESGTENKKRYFSKFKEEAQISDAEFEEI